MFEKLLPVLMNAVLFATLALAAVGLIAMANLALALFSGAAIAISWPNVLLVAVVIRILLVFLT